MPLRYAFHPTVRELEVGRTYEYRGRWYRVSEDGPVRVLGEGDQSEPHSRYVYSSACEACRAFSAHSRAYHESFAGVRSRAAAEGGEQRPLQER